MGHDREAVLLEVATLIEVQQAGVGYFVVPAILEDIQGPLHLDRGVVLTVFMDGDPISPDSLLNLFQRSQSAGNIDSIHNRIPFH